MQFEEERPNKDRSQDPNREPGREENGKKEPEAPKRED